MTAGLWPSCPTISPPRTTHHSCRKAFHIPGSHQEQLYSSSYLLLQPLCSSLNPSFHQYMIEIQIHPPIFLLILSLQFQPKLWVVSSHNLDLSYQGSCLSANPHPYFFLHTTFHSHSPHKWSSSPLARKPVLSLKYPKSVVQTTLFCTTLLLHISLSTSSPSFVLSLSYAVSFSRNLPCS